METSHQKYKDGRTDKEIANKADSYIAKVDIITDEVTKYNVMSENKHLKSSMLNTLKAQRDLFEVVKSFGSYKSKEDAANKMTAFENASMKFIEVSLAFDNEMSLVTKGKSTYELTLANYRKINKGDSYAKVCRLVKMPGTLTNSMESNLPLIGKRTLEHYVWKNGSSYMRIMFENGEVYQMEQEGLK